MAGNAIAARFTSATVHVVDTIAPPRPVITSPSTAFVASGGIAFTGTSDPAATLLIVVPPGDTDPVGIEVGALQANGGTFADAAGNPGQLVIWRCAVVRRCAS